MVRWCVPLRPARLADLRALLGLLLLLGPSYPASLAGELYPRLGRASEHGAALAPRIPPTAAATFDDRLSLSLGHRSPAADRVPTYGCQRSPDLWPPLPSVFFWQFACQRIARLGKGLLAVQLVASRGKGAKAVSPIPWFWFSSFAPHDTCREGCAFTTCPPCGRVAAPVRLHDMPPCHC